MGLGGVKESWQRQTKDFGHTQADQYSVLVLDNRGIGESDKPLMRYSTSEMAKDVVEVLAKIGWIDEEANKRALQAPRGGLHQVSGSRRKDLNVVGISMGGMIVQELALLIPDSVTSLILVSTAARLIRATSYMVHLRSRINLLIPRSLDAQLAYSKSQLYTEPFLISPDPTEHVVAPFPTGGDRFAAGEVKKRTNPEAFPRSGFLCTIIAAGWHHKSKEDLQRMVKLLGGRERICVIHGTEDQMIPFKCGEVLVEEMNDGLSDEEVGQGKGVTRIFEEGQGHVIPIEQRQKFQRTVERVIDRAESLK